MNIAQPRWLSRLCVIVNSRYNLSFQRALKPLSAWQLDAGNTSKMRTRYLIFSKRLISSFGIFLKFSATSSKQTTLSWISCRESRNTNCNIKESISGFFSPTWKFFLAQSVSEHFSDGGCDFGTPPLLYPAFESTYSVELFALTQFMCLSASLSSHFGDHLALWNSKIPDGSSAFSLHSL